MSFGELLASIFKKMAFIILVVAVCGIIFYTLFYDGKRFSRDLQIDTQYGKEIYLSFDIEKEENSAIIPEDV